MPDPKIFESFNDDIPAICGFDPLSLQPVADLKATFDEVRASRCVNCNILQKAGEHALGATKRYYSAYHDALHQLDGQGTEVPSFDQADVVFRIGIVEDDEGRRLSVSPLTPEEAKAQVNEQQGEQLDRFYDEASRVLDYFQIIRSGCKGTLKLRATDEDVQYTITTCRSPSIVKSNTNRTFPASVTTTHVRPVNET